jgi:hypothetical protein
VTQRSSENNKNAKCGCWHEVIKKYIEKFRPYTKRHGNPGSMEKVKKTFL